MWTNKKAGTCLPNAYGVFLLKASKQHIKHTFLHEEERSGFQIPHRDREALLPGERIASCTRTQ